MNRSPFRTLESPWFSLPVDHVDTDQIIPARFLKTTERHGLAAGLFADWRQDESFALNQKGAEVAKILVTGENFGCGSSREHAAWALWEWGFRVILSPSLADIFRANALNNGLVAVEISEDFRRTLSRHQENDAQSTLRIDLEASVLHLAEEAPETFSMDPFHRRCILQGMDTLDFLLQLRPEIQRFESEHLHEIQSSLSLNPLTGVRAGG